MKDVRQSPDRRPGGRADLARYSSLGIGWPLSVVLLSWGGLALDGRLGTTPLLLLLGLLLGIGGGFYSLYARLVATSADAGGPGRGTRENDED